MQACPAPQHSSTAAQSCSAPVKLSLGIFAVVRRKLRHGWASRASIGCSCLGLKQSTPRRGTENPRAEREIKPKLGLTPSQSGSFGNPSNWLPHTDLSFVFFLLHLKWELRIVSLWSKLRFAKKAGHELGETLDSCRTEPRPYDQTIWNSM